MADKFPKRAKFTKGIHTIVSEDNITTPTDAELDAAFGTPAQLGSGFIGIIDDNSDETASVICWTLNGSWFYAAGTKAA